MMSQNTAVIYRILGCPGCQLPRDSLMAFLTPSYKVTGTLVHSPEIVLLSVQQHITFYSGYAYNVRMMCDQES